MIGVGMTFPRMEFEDLRPVMKDNLPVERQPLLCKLHPTSVFVEVKTLLQIPSIVATTLASLIRNVGILNLRFGAGRGS
jgi:hypothetical protein